MLQALGYEFLDSYGNQVPFGAKGLKVIVEIKTEKALTELKDCIFNVACMDSWLKNYANLTKKVFPNSDENLSGTGATGGLGFALLSYLNANLKSGIDLVIKETELEKHIKDADVVITGEGRLDGQSSMGKAPIGIARMAKKTQ